MPSRDVAGLKNDVTCDTVCAEGPICVTRSAKNADLLWKVTGPATLLTGTCDKTRPDVHHCTHLSQQSLAGMGKNCNFVWKRHFDR